MTTKRIEGKGKKVRGEELGGLKWKGRKDEKGRAGMLIREGQGGRKCKGRKVGKVRRGRVRRRNRRKGREGERWARR